jgi:RNA polymerase sigma factor (sigma-70 family)
VWSPRGPLPRDELHDVYRAHVSAVYAFFAYSVRHDVAEDLTAATFERVVRHWGRFDPARSSQRTWILAIARHLLSDHFRRQQHRIGPSLEEYPELVDRAPAVDDPAVHQTSVETLREWLLRLNAREREVLTLRYGADLSTAAIARILDVTEANVLQISSRALRRLREEIELEEIERRMKLSDSA